MKLKKYISKKLLLRMAFFAAIIGVAVLFDIYFETDSSKLSKVETDQSENQHATQNSYFVAQTNSLSVKSSAQKTQNRKFQIESHDKFIQKYHQHRNYQVLKAEVETQTTPLISSYHYLVFQNYFFSQPDDDPLIS